MLSQFEQLKQRFWHTPAPKMWRKILQSVMTVLHTVRHSGIQTYAAVLTYQTLLTTVPLLAILFTLLKLFGVDAFLKDVLFEALAPLGDSGQEISQYLLQFIRNTETNLLGSLGVVFLILAIFALFAKIGTALNHIWSIQSPNDWKSRILGYAGAICLAIIIGLLAITLNISAKKELLQDLIDNETAALVVITTLSKMASILVTAVMLAIIYSATLNIKVRFRAVFVGGLFCALSWIPLTFIFTKTIVVSHNYSVIYSSFASVIILFIWLNALWLLFLSGGLVAYFVQFPALLRPYGFKSLNAAELAHFIRLVIDHIASRKESIQDSITLNELVNITKLNHVQIQQVLSPLIQRGIISKESGSHRRFCLTSQDQTLSSDEIKDLAYGQVTPRAIS